MRRYFSIIRAVALLGLEVLAVLLLARAGWGADRPDLAPLLSAIRQVESSGRANPPDGDVASPGGPSIGPFQIQRGYWTDSRVPGRYEQCRDLAYAQRVVKAYWRRYEPEALAAGDAEPLARCHNGGWNWRKRDTDAYWGRVHKEMGEGR